MLTDSGSCRKKGGDLDEHWSFVTGMLRNMAWSVFPSSHSHVTSVWPTKEKEIAQAHVVTTNTYYFNLLLAVLSVQIGSTEWVEENREMLASRVVAYLNVDVAVAGAGFHASATPQLDKLLLLATKQVRWKRSQATMLCQILVC